MVRLLEIPSLEQRADQTADVNCGPRSEVMHSGTPNLATHVATKVSAHDVAEVSLSGTASNHLVDLSIIVKMWLKPPRRNRKGPHKVYVHVSEAAAGNRDRLRRGGRLRSNLAAVAALALPAP